MVEILGNSVCTSLLNNEVQIDYEDSVPTTATGKCKSGLGSCLMDYQHIMMIKFKVCFVCSSFNIGSTKS